MKLSWGLFASALSCSASAARPHVTPETARLIIAQRLGLSRFHSIERADPEVIRHINTFGGRQQKLFSGHAAEGSRAHLLMWIENAEQDEATVVINDGSESTQDFVITNPPPVSENDHLLRDLILQAESLPAYPDPQKLTYSASFEIEAAIPSRNKLKLHNEYLSVFRASQRDDLSSQEMASMMSKVHKKAEELGFSTTLVLMPAFKGHTKRTAHPWGAYHVPALGSRQENQEAPISWTLEPSSSPNTASSKINDFAAAPLATNKSPVRGILPSCFDTMAACVKTTHNCSSHGECKLLRKGRGTGSDRESVDCWGCQCTPTVLHVGEDKGMESKTKTTFWAGPACQKKDISGPFWLFVGTGVILAFLVSSAIGMLYSMGSEELPSVIGAGVSGPARK